MSNMVKSLTVLLTRSYQKCVNKIVYNKICLNPTSLYAINHNKEEVMHVVYTSKQHCRSQWSPGAFPLVVESWNPRSEKI